MAEARSAVAELRIHDLEEGKAGVWGDIVREWRKAVVRHYFRTRNTIRNGLWPTSLWNLGAAVIIFYCLLFGDFDIMKPVTKGLWPIGEAMRLPNGTPRWLRVLLISCVLGFIFFFLLMQVRRQVLTVLLHYRGWMYMTPKQMTWSVLLWGFVTKLFSGYSPSL
ncbi:PREDICTED: carnitine O-palmitoyltransferase 1, liver isoform-like, partial [Priapulus caudatus]|uniref:Carnitine O-palmitoyltransferase 1, liver isoform-like n=1 Tax=Priapulus caudatus TaxID=37621 RepID=A0ABM1EVC6_PRICU